MTYNEKKSLYESIMKDVAQTVKTKLNEFGSVVTDSQGRPYGWGLFGGMREALNAQYQKLQKALKIGKREKSLYIHTRNTDLMQAAAKVLFSDSIKLYGRGFVGGIDEDALLNGLKKSTQYIIISGIDRYILNDNEMLSLIANIVDGKVQDKELNVVVALISTIPYEKLPTPFKQRFIEYDLEY